ncbi:conserved hypothetical protein, partial [Ixodes scapularis]
LFKMTERSEELDSWITNWERQCIEEVESSPDLESQIQNEKDTSSQKLWLLFQNSATCVAQLYKGTHPTPARPRQHRVASRTLTKTKWSTGGMTGDSAQAPMSGFSGSTGTGPAGLAKNATPIRREDLVAFLCGKGSAHQGSGHAHPYHHHHHWGSPRQRLALEGVAPLRGQASRLGGGPVGAGALGGGAGGGGAMGGAPPTLGSSRSHSSAIGGVSPPGYRCGAPTAASLSNFIAEEFARHVESRKRGASGGTSPGDVVMDSPTHKRPRLL